MYAVKTTERRRARRRSINRLARIQMGNGALPRECLVTDISTSGVRLHVEGYDVPDDFVLVLSGEDFQSGENLAKECNYRVVWRLGHEIGATFVGLVQRGGSAARF
jgi:PilZ domain-containing protein